MSGLVLALGLGAPLTDSAARPCVNAALDSLAAARRARSALIDRAAFEGRIEERMALIAARDAGYGVEDDVVVALALVDQTDAVDGYRLCDAAGGRAAELIGGNFGIGVDARALDGRWGVALSMVASGDSLSPSDFVATDETLASPDAVGSGTLFWLLEGQITEWVRVGYGQVADAEARYSLGEDESGATASNSVFTATGAPARHFLRVGVPWMGLSAGLLFGEADLDFGELAVRPLPVPGAGALALGGGLRRLDDEAITVTALEARYAVFGDRLRPSAEVAVAWPEARVRSARLRLDGTLGGAMPGQRGSTMWGWLHGDLGGYVEVSRFDSAAVDAAGGEPSTGYVAGAVARGGVRAIDVELSGFVARSRIATLTRLPDAGGRDERGLGFLVRIGW